MEEVLNCYVNFDFDIRLADREFSYRVEPDNRFNRPLQYLFLWYANKNEELYSKNFEHYEYYKEKVEAIKGFCPRLSTNDHNLFFWWGKCHDQIAWSKERVINSKKTSFLVEKKLGIHIDDQEYESDEEIQYLVKKEHGFSGLGYRKTSHHENDAEIIEQQLDRIEDYSSIINDKELFIYKNLIDDYFQYRGTFIGVDTTKIYHYRSLQEMLKRIFTYYSAQYNVKEIQIDSFIYLDDGQKKWRYLCEVNHRKSMGLIAHKIHSILRADCSLFMLMPKKHLNDHTCDISSYLPSKKKGILQLSHFSELIQCFLIVGQSVRDIDDCLKDLRQKTGDSKYLDIYFKLL